MRGQEDPFNAFFGSLLVVLSQCLFKPVTGLIMLIVKEERVARCGSSHRYRPALLPGAKKVDRFLATTECRLQQQLPIA